MSPRLLEGGQGKATNATMLECTFLFHILSRDRRQCWRSVGACVVAWMASLMQGGLLFVTHFLGIDLEVSSTLLIARNREI
jgi:hypothetical protein